MNSVFLAVALLTLPVQAVQREVSPRSTPAVEAVRAMPSTGWLATSIASFDGRQQPSPQTRSPRDSIKNGALIGAVVGAVALGGFGLFLCHALDDTGGDPDCFPEVLGIAAVGAGIGLGAGVAVDLLFVRQAAPGVRIRISF